MTDEELDVMRGEEASRRWGNTAGGPDVSVIAARLGREGWVPPEPLDTEVDYLVDQLKGIADIRVVFRMALERGIEIGRKS